MKMKVFRTVCALFIAALLVNSGKAALSDGLVSHWPLDASDNSMATDGTGNNPMTIQGPGDIEIVPGQKGNAFAFNGTHYLISRHSADNTATGLPIYKAGSSYTISMWVKGAAQTAKYLFSHGNTNNNNPLFILQTGAATANSRLDVIIRPDTGAAPVNHLVSTTTVFDNTWHHIAWVDNAGSVSLYIDGVLDSANFNYTPVGTYTFNDTVIGSLVRTAVATGAIFTGAIDDVGIWKRALTAAEVQEVLSNGVPVVSQVVAPTFVAEPQDVTKQTGDWALFSVDVAGTRPLTYQWYRNNQLIDGATGPSYQAVGLTPANSGDVYHVTVSNSAGQAVSRQARVTVEADPAADLRNNLVNYWPLNTIKTVNGELITEDLYSRNDMVLVNFLDENDVAPGKVGNSLSFDFVTKYTYRTNGAPIYSRSNYTVAMWVKGLYTDGFSPQVDRRVFSEGSSTDNDPLFTIGTDNASANMSPSATIFVRSDSGAITEVVGRRSTRPVFDDAWNHIVWTDANGQGKLYINGVLDETDFSYTRPALTLNTTSLGAVLRAAAASFFFGQIDEVATWGRVLSWTEIQELMNNGVPAPTVAIPVSIVTHPTSPANVFTGDMVSFTVQPGGTAPFTYQWRKNGEPISLAANPTAQSATLVISSAQAADNGAYSVVVSNSAGSATSNEAPLSVASYGAGEVVKFDVGLTGSPNPQPGFPEFNIGLNGKSYNGVKVTVTAVEGATLAERNRTTGTMVTNNPPTLTQAQIYNDFIFANSTADGAGLEVLLEGLTPNTKYDLTLWSFDPQSTGDRFADWHETSSGVPIELQAGYTFNGSVLPAADEERTIKAQVTSSTQGTLLLRGMKSGGTALGVFLNGLRLTLPSQGEIRITDTRLVGGKIRFTIEKASQEQQISIQQRADVGTGQWEGATGGGVVESQGTTAIAEFPASASHMFYRVAATP